MALNLRSQRLNYHPIINTLTLWDNCLPKRLVQAFNHFGITSSYTSQIEAIKAITASAIKLARIAAADETKIKLIPYDNFNWMARAWEATSLHFSITHNEVSALLVILELPEGPNAPSAAQITDICCFAETAGTRHTLPPHIALTKIMPTCYDPVQNTGVFL
jgi:hypothetical protein